MFQHQCMRGICAALLITLSATAGVAQSSAPLRGDANCDGRVDQADVDKVLAIVFGGLNDCDNSDVNDDGRVSVADTTAVLAILISPPQSPTPSETATTAATATATPPPSVTPTVDMTRSATPSSSPS